MKIVKAFSIALISVATIASATAATIQNDKGTFIRDRNGAWHQYVRARDKGNGHIANVYAEHGPYGYAQQLDVAKGSISNW